MKFAHVRSVLLLLLPFGAWCSLLSLSWSQEGNQAPTGYTALFNGKDLSGWYGLAQINPRELAAMSTDDRQAMRTKNQADVHQHWSVQDGELINDGNGLYLATDKDYKDFDLWIDYKTVPLADSGIYLRGNPQVQIWDSTEAGGKWNIGADKGSGGLWNNRANSPGKDPSELADKPFGEWNRFRIMQIGARTTVWLNGKKVVDHAIMDNFNGFGAELPHYHTGPIQLQTHGGEIRWRNIFVREIGTDEANRLLAEQKKDSFKSIFNGKDFSGWKGPTDNYDVQDGVVMCKAGKGGTIYTADEYDDFVVRLEFKLPPAGNNGLAIRYPGEGDTAYVGMCELQVLDTEHPQYNTIDPRQAHGSAYGIAPAHRGYLRPTGEWNFQEVTVEGSTIRVELNGNVILDADVSKITSYMADSPHPGKDRRSGYFGFAGHGDAVQFRNIQMKRISPSKAAAVEKAQLGDTVNVHQCGSLFLAGQPSAEAIGKLKSQGIDLVIDLRTPGEIDWNEGEKVAQAGLKYECLGFKPDTLTTEVFDRVRELLGSASKQGHGVMLHCGSANRVGAVWLAHRVLDQGIGWEQALEEAKEVGLKSEELQKKAAEYVQAKQKQ